MTNQKHININEGVLFLDAATINIDDLDLSQLTEIAKPLQLFSTTSPSELEGRTPGAWCVITNKVALNRAFFHARPNLRLVCVLATGTNCVDLKAAQDYGVAVANCRGYSTETVAQHTLMLILVLTRNFLQYHKDVQAGAWSDSPLFCLNNHPINELEKLTLGIIGYGEIGARVKQLAETFHMKVNISERLNQKPRSGRKDFNQVIESSDIISLHCPLTDETKGLINNNVISRMKNSALLINTSRGELINEADFLDALSTGKLAGAAVDVLSHEPPVKDHPLLKAKLNNLIITPHCAWSSTTARQTAIVQTAENISAWLENKNLRRVI